MGGSAFCGNVPAARMGRGRAGNGEGAKATLVVTFLIATT